MRILFMGDASNMHNCLAGQLRRLGHDVTVASHGSRWMNTERDIDLFRPAGHWGAVRYLARIVGALPKLRGFDIVQLVNPIFLDLKPAKVRPVFDYLKRHNRAVVLSALGTDYVYYAACHDGHTYRYSDYFVGSEPSPYVGSPEYHAQEQDNWRQPFMKRHNDYIVDRIDGAVACLWEYYVAYRPVLGNRVAYAGIPIDLDTVDYTPLEREPQRVRFFLGIQRDRTLIKGTDRLLDALRRVHDRHPDKCEMEVVENVPYHEYVERMRSSHVLLDQIYSYTPATNALLAMAQGLVAVSGGEPEYYDLIGERDNRPIINVDPRVEGDIDRQLEHIIAHKRLLPEMSRNSRAFVERHHNVADIARRYLDFWNKILADK